MERGNGRLWGLAFVCVCLGGCLGVCFGDELDEIMKQSAGEALQATATATAPVRVSTSATATMVTTRDARAVGATQPFVPAMRLIRLRYKGDWDLNYGRGGDQNLLHQYGVLMRVKVAASTEAIDIAHLDAYRPFRAPPMVYLTGSGALRVEEGEVAALQRYLLKKHGMLFADAGGAEFAKSFRTLIATVLKDVKPEDVPADDGILKEPFGLKSIPYAKEHDPPMVLTGWKVDGRWVALYHPGGLSDLWKDGHGDAKPETVKSAYELGANVIDYAHRRYAEWLVRENTK